MRQLTMQKGLHMNVNCRLESGSTVRVSMADYIGEKFLDLVEQKPFYEMRVRELVQHAGISRSTFYVHYNSIYDVVQRLEDTFLEGFYPEEIALPVLLGHDTQQAAEQISYVKQHARTVRLLCGPNGDSYFISRIERIIRKLLDLAFEELRSDLPREQRDYLGAYIAGGTLAATRYVAEKADTLGPQEIERVADRIIAANDILLKGAVKA